MSFTMVLAASLLLIANINISDDYIIEQTAGTGYDKIAWNLNLINNYPERIKGSAIFLGPSLVQGGICDSVLSSKGIPAVNMGVNHRGNEVSFFFIQRIIKHKPRKIYVDLSQSINTGIHPMTPLLYSPYLLINSGQYINVNFINYLSNRVRFVLKYFIWDVFGDKTLENAYHNYGVVYEGDELMPVDVYNSAQNELINTTSHGNGIMDKIKNIPSVSWVRSHFFYNKSSQCRFLENAFITCSKHNIKISELYVPVVSDAKCTKDFDQSFFAQRKTFSVASVKNFKFLDDISLWRDLHHLNKKGAILFTNELITQRVVE